MAKARKSKKSSTRGKGKVTPVQVAFIVERYLNDNNYASALTAFRSDAAGVLPKIKSKELPKGLLGLEDILDEYIKLKEDKIMIDQEKLRIEVAFKGLQEVMTNYITPQSPPTSESTNLSGCSPSQGQMVNGSIINRVQPPLPDQVSEHRRYPTRLPNSSSSGKRKGTTFTSNPPPPKKRQPKALKSIPLMQGSTSNSEVNAGKTGFQASSAQTDPFSPKTPTVNQTPDVVISPQTIIISPVKCISPWKHNKREHVKARLDFDESCDPQSSTDILAVDNSPFGKYNEEAEVELDFELPDFSLFDDFSKLLADIEFGCEQTESSLQSSDSADSFTSFE